MASALIRNQLFLTSTLQFHKPWCIFSNRDIRSFAFVVLALVVKPVPRSYFYPPISNLHNYNTAPIYYLYLYNVTVVVTPERIGTFAVRNHT